MLLSPHPVILAIESSCDETAAAIGNDGKIISNALVTQEIHSQYGGIVPELASRAHDKYIIPVVKQALKEANISMRELDAIAFTQGPGLLGPLLVGASFAKAVAWGLGIPLIGVHHLRAHLLANFIEPPYPKFPFLGLVVSGGHTILARVDDYMKAHVLGTTQDDAIGEAFDKIAKQLGFPYPGGAQLDHHAQKGDPGRFVLPRSVMPGLDYSFSGIKTAVIRLLNQDQGIEGNLIEGNLYDYCASIQAALIDMLLDPLIRGVQQTNIKTIVLGGGVAANKGLRQSLDKLSQRNGWEIFIPNQSYCTDNAAMIAVSAHYQYKRSDFCDLTATSYPRYPLN